MSEGGRKDRSGHGKPSAPAQEHDDPNFAPGERGLFGASRMDGVRAERNEVAAGLRNRLAVMRKSDGKAAPTAIPEGGGAPLPGAVRAHGVTTRG